MPFLCHLPGGSETQSVGPSIDVLPELAFS